MALRPELGSGSRAEGARAVQASWHPDVRPSARTRQLGSAIAVFLCSAAGPFLRPGQSIMRRAARSVGQGWPRGHRRRRRGGVPLRPARWGPAAALTEVSTTRRSPSRGTMSSAATHWVMVLSAVRDAAARWHRGRLAPQCPERGRAEACRKEGRGVAGPRPGGDRRPPGAATLDGSRAGRRPPSCRGRRARHVPAELAAAAPDAVHHHRELARHGHLRPPRADARRQPLAPVRDRVRARMPRQ